MSTSATVPNYMFLFREPLSPPELAPDQMQQSFQRWLDWVAAMRAKGQYVAGEPLEPTPGRVLRGAPVVAVTDGPYAEAKEVIGGYMVIRAASLVEAEAIARDCPGLADGGSVEVRQVMPVSE
ncbi:YCII-related domain protein [Lacunisphaera limnophila]|uniref:YCII-related domain protein n=1 Tax=Lacunisphaera limnophila TaxID=1838286 RepID=A0A1D8ARH0_9BACT|nr:YciI family protein [Lacunisphaera limnophila]AOS43477.1 YCII-related domain protein [Lacunisphaera limnophila]